MAKKKAVKKAVGGKSKASSAKHIVPNGFWQQVLALLALVFAGILFLAIAGIGGGAPKKPSWADSLYSSIYSSLFGAKKDVHRRKCFTS